MIRKSMWFSLLSFLSVAVYGQGIVNGNFDLGRNNGWTETSKGNYILVGTGSSFASTEITPQVNPLSGQYMGRIGGFSYEVNSLSQTVALPASTPLYLKLYVQDRNASISDCAGLWVGAQIRVSVAGQTIYDTYLCQYNQLNSWTPVYFNLSALAGQTVPIIFQADAANTVWSYLYIDDVSLTNHITGVVKESNILPATVELQQNYPNPFNPSTTIRYALPTSALVKVTIHDLLGRELETLVNEIQSAGWKEVLWNGYGVPSGLYLYRIQSGKFTGTKKMMLLK